MTQLSNSNSRRQLDAENVKPEHFYTFLTTYYFHQDRISVDRIQTLIAIGAGVLAGTFALQAVFLRLVLVVLGTLLLECIWRLCERDWNIRDNNVLPLLDSVHGAYGFRMTNPTSKWRKGSYLMPLAVRVIEIVNILLFVLLLLHSAGVGCLYIPFLLGVSPGAA